MKFRSILVTVVALSSFSAFAQTMTISMVGSLSSVQTYKRSDTQGPYVMDSSLSKSRNGFKIHSENPIVQQFAEEYNKKEEPETESRSVVGKGIPGRAHVTFGQGPDKNFYFAFDYKLEVPLPGADPLKVDDQYQIQVEFVQGSYEDYLSGKTVEVRATSEGEKAYFKSYSKANHQILLFMAKILGKMGMPSEILQLKDVEDRKIAFDAAPGSPSGNVFYRMDLNQIECRQAQLSYEYAVAAESKVVDELTDRLVHLLDASGSNSSSGSESDSDLSADEEEEVTTVIPRSQRRADAAAAEARLEALEEEMDAFLEKSKEFCAKLEASVGKCDGAAAIPAAAQGPTQVDASGHEVAAESANEKPAQQSSQN